MSETQLAEEQKLGELTEESILKINDSLTLNENVNGGAKEIFEEITTSIDTSNLEYNGKEKNSPEAYRKIISDIMAAIRHKVYTLGLAGGPQAIDIVAKSQENLENKNTEELTPEEYQRFLVAKSLIALDEIAKIEKTKRDQALGPIRARFLRLDPLRFLDKYFDVTNKNQIKQINKNTPENDLLNIIAISEIADGNEESLKTIPRDYDIGTAGKSLKPLENDIKEKFRRAKIAAEKALTMKLITRNPELVDITVKFFPLEYYLAVLRQMPDTLSEGVIGSKAAGYAISHAALKKPSPELDETFATQHKMSVDDLHKKLDLRNRLKEGKSNFIGSLIFEETLDFNPTLAETSTLKTYYQNGQEPAPEKSHIQLQEAILKAKFPPHIERQLKILFLKLCKEQIITRSSSELEDTKGAAFAGKYTSVELPNSEEDFKDLFEKFKKAILTVYASVFSKDVMEYRKLMNLIIDEEQMGILIQELIGKRHGKYFYPLFSVVAMSHATQSTGLDPTRGAMRIAAGLGGQVVEKGGGIFLMFEKPRATFSGPKQNQKKMTVLNMEKGIKEEVNPSDLFTPSNSWNFDPDDHLAPEIKSYAMENSQSQYSLLTFKNLIECEDVILVIEYIVQKLKYHFEYDVDCELVVDRDEKSKDWTFTVVQCRPQNIPKNLRPSTMPKNVDQKRILIKTENTVNATFATNIPYLIYVDPEVFTGKECTENIRSFISRYISKINEKFSKENRKKYIIMAPRSWGSTEPNSGIPATFGQFSNSAGIIEITDGMSVPSFGTHFLQDFMDAQMIASTCTKEDILNKDFFTNACSSKNLPSPKEVFIEDTKTNVGEILSKYIKIIDINKEFQKTSENPNKKFAIHIAQNNIPGQNSGAAVYIAEENEDLPIPVNLKKQPAQ